MLAVRVAGAAVAATAVLVLVGWSVGPVSVTSVLPGLPTMKVNTALCLLLLALGVVVPTRVVVVVGSAVVAAVGVTSLVEIAAGTTWIDQLLVADDVSTTGTPGQMALITAACLTALAACGLLPGRGRVVLALRQGLAAAVLLVAALAVLTYVYGPGALYRLGPFSTVAVHTAVALALLAAAVLAATPGGVVSWATTDETSRAVVVRWLVPSSVLVLPTIGYLALRGERAGLYTTEFSLVLALVATAVLLTLSALLAARALTRSAARAERVVRSMPIGYLALATDGTVIATNPRAADLLGAPAATVVGTPLVALLPVGSGRAVADALHLLARDRTPASVTVHRPAEPAWFEASLHPTDTGYEAYLVDVTADHTARALLHHAAVHDQVVATTLQAALIPSLPEAPGVLLAARYLTASVRDRVGGDWYDAVPHADGSVSVTVGDVAGHTITAAAAMGRLRAMSQALESGGEHPPSGTLQRVDRTMAGAGTGDTTTATMICARIVPDEDGATMTWSNAGHPPPVVVGPDGTAAVLERPSDLLLGVDAGSARHDHVVRLPRGATVVLYTDGLVETRTGDVTTGISELAAGLGRAADDDVEHLVESVTRDLAGRHRDDDVALLAVRLATAFDATVHLPPQRRASSAARAFVAAAVGAVDAEWVDDLLVVTAELVTNAVMHGRAPVSVRVTREAGAVRLAVTDAGAPLPGEVASPARSGQSHGRGLLLVTALTAAWGQLPTGSGKTVWARVVVPEQAGS